MFISTTESIAGYRVVESLGLVTGSVVMTKHVGRDIMAGLKSLVGGELRGYTELLQEARNNAIDRMNQQAAQWGANAILCVRLGTASITPGSAELIAYGTAVKVQAEN